MQWSVEFSYQARAIAEEHVTWCLRHGQTPRDIGAALGDPRVKTFSQAIDLVGSVWITHIAPRLLGRANAA